MFSSTSESLNVQQADAVTLKADDSGSTSWKLSDLFTTDANKSPVSVASLLTSGKVLTEKFHSMISGTQQQGTLPALTSPSLGKPQLPRTSTPLAKRSLYSDNASKVTDLAVASSDPEEKCCISSSVNQVSAAFQRQEAINQTNAQLVKLNYMVNLANFMKQRTVEESVAAGRRQLFTLNQRVHEQELEIERLNDSVDSLTYEVGHQKELSERLSTSLYSQQDLLSRTILESRAEMERQCQLIDKQQRMVQKLLQQKVRHDFLIDSSLLLFSVYLSNSILLKYPLDVLVNFIPQKKTQIWTRSLVKYVFIIRIFIMLKRLSVRSGVHNSVGSFVPYMQTFGGYMLSKLEKYQLFASLLVRVREKNFTERSLQIN